MHADQLGNRMSHTQIDQHLLDRLKRIAKKRRRDDPSLSYNQWLDSLSSKHGFATFESLRRRVDELERLAHNDAIVAEEMVWEQRLAAPAVWGTLPTGQGEHDETVPLPKAPPHSVPWPNCFRGAALFTAADGPRKQLDGPVKLYMGEAVEMHFKGEELRKSDQIVLEGLILTVGHYPCGRLAECTNVELNQALGRPLPEWGMPIQYDAIIRTLWRLVHCELTVEDFGFKGPILSYVDARRAPSQFAIRLNPAFANFYYPFLRWPL